MSALGARAACSDLFGARPLRTRHKSWRTFEGF